MPPFGRRVDPLNPLSSLGPSPRLGQGVPGGRLAVGRNLINPLNPASSLPRLSPIEMKFNRLKSGPTAQNIQSVISSAKRGRFSGGSAGADWSQLQFKPHEVDTLRRLGVTPDLLPSMVEVLQGKKEFGPGRHHSMFGTVMRTLGAVEAAGAGFVSGAERYQEKHGLEKDPLKYIRNPSHIYKELGAGFSEVPDSVSEGYTYKDLIKQSTDPNSLAHKWAMPIGLGMSILFDPTTYVTFGATSASKTAAYHLLAEADKHAATRAADLISKNFGKRINTIHGPVTANWKNIDEITSHVKVSSGSPFTLGDALDQLKTQGLRMKQEVRKTGRYVGPEGDIVKAGTRQRLGAALLPGNVKGGRGTRFMGMTLPGTAKLGEKMAGTTREAVEANKVRDTLGEILVPDWGARHVADDSARASALVEMSRIKTRLHQARTAIAGDVREMQRPFVAPTVKGTMHLSLEPIGNHVAPTADDIAQHPYLNYFRVFQDPDNPARVVVGSPGKDHHEIIEELGVTEDWFDDWYQGTGVFDPETGEIAKVSITRRGKDTGQGGGISDPLMQDPELDAAATAVSKKAYNFPIEDEALHNLLEEGGQMEGKRILVKPEERYGLLDMEVGLTPAQQTLKENINSAAELYIKRASDAGLGEKAMRKLWDDLADFYNDPLLALAEFKFKSTARTMAKGFIDDVLKDRRFALPMAKDPANAAAHELVHAPAGYTAYQHGVNRYAVRNSIIEGVKDLSQPARLDTNLQRGFRVLNIAQDWWKMYATSPNPAFHVMNFLGATWNNALAGVYNPVDYFDAMRTLYQGRREEAAQVGAKFGVTRKVPESTPQGRGAQQVLREAEARSGLGRTSFLFGDIARGHYSAEQLAMSDIPIGSAESGMAQRVAKEGIETGQNLVERLTKPPPGVSKKRFYGVTTPRRAAGAALAISGNPIAFAAFMPEMAKLGRRFGGTVEDMVRLAPFQKYAKDPQIKRVLAEYGPINSAMHVEYKGFSDADQQIMYDIGANISRQFQFDYSNLTPFERYVAKTVFPFWTYHKNNIALQIQQLAKRPMLFGVANKTMNYINENGENYAIGPWREILPAYFENLEAFQVPVPNQVRGALGLPKDQPLYLNPKLPFLSINMIPNFYEILRDPNMATTQKLREIIAPAAGAVGPFSGLPVPGGKILLEAGTGYNLGLNRPIDYQRLESGDIRHGFTPAPSWVQMLPEELTKYFGVTEGKDGEKYVTHTANYVLEQLSTPFINNLGNAIPISGASEKEQNKQRANLVSWMSGVRLMPVDVLRLNRNAAYDTLNHLEAKQSEQKYLGKSLSPDELVELHLLRAHLKIVEDAWDQRESEGAYSGAAE